MSFVQRHSVELTTDANGDAVGYTPVVSGLISQIRYEKTDFDNGVEFDVSVEETGEVVWSQDTVNASATVAPRQATHGTDGAAALFAANGKPVLDAIAVADSRLKIEVAKGGNVKGGTVHVTLV